MSSTAINTFSIVGLQPYVNPGQARRLSVALDNSLTLVKGTILGEKLGTNAIQKVVISGSPTGGTFTLTFGAQTTAGIAFGATKEQVQAAFEALSSVGNGNAKVTGGWVGTGAVFFVEYTGTLGQAVQSTLTCSIASMTGGTPAQATSSTQSGAAGSPGVFKAYNEANTDGSQFPRCILQYDCATDGSGNITLGGASGGGDWGETYKTAPAFFSGTFLTADLTGYDDSCARQPGWRLVSGTPTSGVVRVG
ncbi:MAG: hypothetical protein KGL39_10720 [Patescibacteria group bacterium]|nr:hypothetical protein [Patescibacteria group bacterium]